ncbi:copper amine oxidase N-terminal domain-containing protein [Paenibacillus sp. M1]|uniref:Copper amine oxidase N-terminal domain-containing protein n=1 Tax=Paenibacillus haidiansis TaxID=1574488 RepID=A0ABU7VYX0_9BACL
MMKNTKSVSKVAAVTLAFTVTLASVGLPGYGPLQASAAETVTNQKSTLTLEHQTYKQSGQLYLPLREVAAYLDLQLTYDNASKSLELTGVTQFAKFKVGSLKATGKNGVTVSLGAPVQQKQGVTYVPASLFAKLFGIPVTATGTKDISYVYSSKYTLIQTDGMLFWLNRDKGVLYAGPSGQLPVRSGTVNIEYPDWLGMDAHKIDENTYVVNINNAYGEPHIFNTRYRVLLHNGTIVRQTGMSFGGPSYINLEPDVLSYDGKILMNNGRTANLVKQDGTVVETIDLEKIGGPDDVYSVEAMESDFLLIRPYSTGTLLLVDRESGETTPIYKSMLDQGIIEQIDNDEFGIGDGLKYIGRSGNQLKFSWKFAYSGAEPVTKVYVLPE